MAETIKGPLTGALLGDISPLLQPWAPDALGILRPPLTTAGLRLSAELAAATYALDVEPWLAAGWQDVAIQYENTVASGIGSGTAEENAQLAQVTSDLRLNTLRAMTRLQDPLTQTVGTIRQLYTTDTGKALVMVHPAPEGRYVVAISFMGTTPRVYDWFANFRMASEGGAHRGFLQLARQFEGHEELIAFPDTARQLGLDRLTLREVLAECARPDSRFTLWLSGHSQGGAIMQVYTHLKMHEQGVLPQHLIGYGLASPAVATATSLDRPDDYPLYLLMNSDDVVPRIGGMVHLGQCLVFEADAELRAACYRWPMDALSIHRRLLCRPVLDWVKDTPSGIELGTALLRQMLQVPAEEFFPALRFLTPTLQGLNQLAPQAGSQVERLVHFLLRRAAAAHQSMAGRPLDEARVAEAEALLVEVGSHMPLGDLMASMSQLALPPHSVSGDSGEHNAYTHITLHGTDRLIAAHWQAGENAQLMRLPGYAAVG